MKHKLKPFALRYIKAQDKFYKEIQRIEKAMTKHFNDGYEYEIFNTDYGWLIGRIKDGGGEVLGHDCDWSKKWKE